MKLLSTLFLIGALTFSAPAQTPKAAKEPKASSSKKVPPANPVDLNTASQAELESIPGVGAPTAKKIIAGRPYSTPADLSKTGISAKTIQEISPMVKASGGSAAQSRAPLPPAAPAPSRATPAPTSAPAPSIPAKNASAPPSGPGQQPPSPGMVWVNLETKVYHRSGDRWYGKTKKGKFMNEQDAQKAGYRETKEK